MASACTGSSCRPSTEWTPARERRRLSWTSWTSSPRRQISRACWCRCAWPTAWSSSAATAMCFTSSSSQPTRAAAPRPSTTSLVTSTPSSRSPPGARRRSHSRSSRCASATSTRCSPRRPSSPGTSSAAPTARTGSASTRPTSIRRPGSLLSHFPSGSFGDGGYLDNKPFSHAIDALVTRHAEVPVERKLIYVEPAPDHPEDTAPLRRQPDAIENSLAALVEIPGYETIRGDLQTVLERNRGMERVSRILKGVEREIEAAIAREGVGAGRNLPVSDWARLDVREIVERFGLPYLAYTQLKVSSVTDDLTTTFARVFRFDADSAFFRASRRL